MLTYNRHTEHLEAVYVQQQTAGTNNVIREH